MKGMIKEWSEEDRPREKLKGKGGGALTTSELIAILLRTGNNGANAVEVASQLLELGDGSLRRIASFPIEHITSVAGIGETKAIVLMAAFELGKRFMEESVREEAAIYNSIGAASLMRPVLAPLDHEECWVIYLNRANRIIARECISKGGTSTAAIDIKRVVKKSVERLASGIILFHNHPSGSCKPSNVDCRYTASLKDALKLLEIDLIDHIIVGGGEFYSFSDSGSTPWPS
ncbi:MAG: DNA repair protein RadC [Bacteroidales bacterium]|nr:DNA repair protein RadC [Bacteroidales bacterium]